MTMLNLDVIDYISSFFDCLSILSSCIYENTTQN